jgi:uncharacterized OB-fold protein
MTTPVREGLFREGPDGPTLLAGRCPGCGHTSFPATERCLECHGRDVETVELGGRAELLCATTVHRGSPRFAAGYQVGYVILPGGVRIFAPLAGTPLEPGTALRLEIAPMWRDGERDVLAYRFVPEQGS